MNHFEKYESYIPFDLFVTSHFVKSFFVLLFIINFRYFLMVGAFWYAYYKRRHRLKSIYHELPSSKEQLFEIKWSIYSSLTFAVVAVFWGMLWQSGYTEIYLSLDFPLWFWVVSVCGLLLLHETYFYWTHRWLHINWVYKKFHSVHHASLKPSPWASFSFHPVESLINAMALPLISLIWPVHPVVILFHLTLMTLTAITNHLGYEVLFKNKWGKLLGRHIVSGVHHGQHHRYFTSNYGLFFTWWDRLCKTEHRRFEEHFEQVVEGRSVW